MALSMDEQRILDEIERGLTTADPVLATRMASFGAPRRIAALRPRLLRLVASLMTLVVVAMASVLVYALVPFRTAADRHVGSKASSSPAQPVMTTPSHAARPQQAQSQQAKSQQAKASGAASAGPASAAPASTALGNSAASTTGSRAPSTRAGISASPAAHQQTRGAPAQ